MPPEEFRRLCRLRAILGGPFAASHPIPLGEIVTVIRVPPKSAPYIEGRAVVKGTAHSRHRYRVQFGGDPVLRERTVHPDYQRNPERFLEILRDLWRASNAPDVDEFFPDDN